MDKILTIVIPTYNMEKYLRKCLNSLIIGNKSLFDILEVLVVNDGSKDSSSAIAHEYQEKYPNVFKVIDKENGNYGSCVNRGLSEAVGKYVKILDADDCFNTRALPEFLSQLLSIDVDMIITDYSLVSSHTEKKISFCIEKNKVYDVKNRYVFNSLFNLQMHGVTYKREVLLSINYFQSEGISYTDQEWIFSPVKAVNSLIYIPILIYMYTIGRDGQTMDMEIYKNKVKDRIVGLYVMFDSYKNQLQNNCKDYLLYKMSSRMKGIYKTILLDQEDSDNQVLIELDDYIRENLLELYEYSNKWPASKMCPFFFIKQWRENNHFLIFPLYYKIFKILQKIK